VSPLLIRSPNAADIPLSAALTHWSAIVTASADAMVSVLSADEHAVSRRGTAAAAIAPRRRRAMRGAVKVSINMRTPEVSRDVVWCADEA
jgi:hypothetical protein